METIISKKNSNKFNGKYVAIRSFTNKQVICSGTNPSKVLSNAKKIVEDPVIFFIPKKGMINLY